MAMIMPIRQRCPSCGEYFMGSDAIGDDCFNCRAKINLDPSKETIDRVARAIEIAFGVMVQGILLTCTKDAAKSAAQAALSALQPGDLLSNDCMVRKTADCSNDQLSLYEEAIAKDQAKLKEAREIIAEYVERDTRWNILMNRSNIWLNDGGTNETKK